MTTLGNETFTGIKTFAQYQLANQPNLSSGSKQRSCKVGQQQEKMTIPAVSSKKLHCPAIEKLTKAINTKGFVEKHLPDVKKEILELKQNLTEAVANLNQTDLVILRKYTSAADAVYERLSDIFKDFYAKIEAQKQNVQKVSAYPRIEKELYPVISAIHRLSEETLTKNQEQFDEKLKEAKDNMDAIDVSLKELASELDSIKPLLDAMDHGLYIKEHPEQYNINLFGSYWGEKTRLSPKDTEFFAKKESKIKITPAIKTNTAPKQVVAADKK
ncbi:MAG TPA: hypothetical protein PLC42_03985 [Parachlamydiaceae bacterium]|nr:hypothetical protein [Parachlamydiaceae bacterium]